MLHAKGNGGKVALGPDNNVYVVTENGVSANPNEPHVQTMTENYRNSTIVDGRSEILRITQDGNPVGQGILGNKFYCVLLGATI